LSNPSCPILAYSSYFCGVRRPFYSIPILMKKTISSLLKMVFRVNLIFTSKFIILIFEEKVDMFLLVLWVDFDCVTTLLPWFFRFFLWFRFRFRFRNKWLCL